MTFMRSTPRWAWSNPSRPCPTSSPPSAGKSLEVNPALEADPALVNRDPFGEGWMVKIKLNGGAPGDLLVADAYETLVAQS